MPRYNVPVLRPRGITQNDCETVAPRITCARDLVLHVLLARIAAGDDSTTEVETRYNPEQNALDIDIPEDILQVVESIGIGPNLQRFMDWLHPINGIGDIEVGDITADGLRISNGNEKWDDLRVPVSSLKAGGNRDPAFTQIFDNGAASIGVFTYKFSDEAIANNEKELFFVAQMPHAWKEGSNIRPHVHWVPTTDATGVVRWGMEYTWTNPNGDFPNTTIVYADSSQVSSDAGKHVITGLGEIDAAGKTLSAMLLCRIFRNSSHGNDTYAADAGLLEIDFHHRIDSLGSEQEYIKDD